MTGFGGIFDKAFNGCKAQARKPPRRRHFDPAKVQIQLPTLEVYVPQVWTLKNFVFSKSLENSQLFLASEKIHDLKKPWTTNFPETLPNLWFSQPWQLVFEATNGPSFPTPEPSYAKDDIYAEAVSEIQERNRANNPANHYKRPRFESTWVCDLWVRMQVVPWG